MTDPNPKLSGGRPQLSPMLAYQIRRMLRQNLDLLQFTMTTKVGLKVDPVSDLDAALDNLYTEDQDLAHAVQELERLALCHQALSGKGSSNRKELEQVNQQIFSLLGYQKVGEQHEGKILLVDDAPTNLKILEASLVGYGYEVLMAINGSTALKIAQEQQPDLILLDIMMPQMDGYEVFRHLKAQPLTQDIPVIFVSAINEVLDKVRAFKIGGVDYITKPFQIEEVLVRVGNQLKARNLQKRLEDQNVRFQAEICDHQKKATELQKEISRYQRLLNCFLPSMVADRLVQESDRLTSLTGEALMVEHFPELTVLCAEIVDFQRLAYIVQPVELINLVSRFFIAFDFLCEEHRLEKVRAIGGGYWVVGGVPPTETNHVEAIANLALGMQQFVVESREIENADLAIRIGISTGPVVTGLTGMQHLGYDLWGETVVLAQQLQTYGQGDRIRVSPTTYERLKDRYQFEPAEALSLGHLGIVNTYWLNANLPVA